MADKKILKKLFVAGAATGLLSTALGSAFIEKYLSKKGIKSAIASSALNPSEDSNCFYESDEAKLGIEFYRSKPCKEIFTFNKFSRTLFADYYEAEPNSNVFVISCLYRRYLRTALPFKMQTTKGYVTFPITSAYTPKSVYIKSIYSKMI